MRGCTELLLKNIIFLWDWFYWNTATVSTTTTADFAVATVSSIPIRCTHIAIRENYKLHKKKGDWAKQHRTTHSILFLFDLSTHTKGFRWLDMNITRSISRYVFLLFRWVVFPKTLFVWTILPHDSQLIYFQHGLTSENECYWSHSSFAGKCSELLTSCSIRNLQSDIMQT